MVHICVCALYLLVNIFMCDCISHQHIISADNIVFKFILHVQAVSGNFPGGP